MKLNLETNSKNGDNATLTLTLTGHINYIEAVSRALLNAFARALPPRNYLPKDGGF